MTPKLTKSVTTFYTIDVEKRIDSDGCLHNEKLFMQVLSSKKFNYRKNKPKFSIEKAPWLRRALKSLGLRFQARRVSRREVWLNLHFLLLNKESDSFSAQSQLKSQLKTGICLTKLFMLYYNYLEWLS